KRRAVRLARGGRVGGLSVDVIPAPSLSSLLTPRRAQARRVLYGMERRIQSWHSPNLGMEMPIVAYGHAGYPLLMFPTAAADFLEYERFHLIDAVAHYIEQGRVRIYSINSVNRYALLNEQSSPQWKAEILSRYDRYVTD